MMHLPFRETRSSEPGTTLTQAQIMGLEQLFHETSHPTGEQHENLVNECDLYIPHPQNSRSVDREFLICCLTRLGSKPVYRELQSGSRTSGRRNGNPR